MENIELGVEGGSSGGTERKRAAADGNREASSSPRVQKQGMVSFYVTVDQVFMLYRKWFGSVSSLRHIHLGEICKCSFGYLPWNK